MTKSGQGAGVARPDAGSGTDVHAAEVIDIRDPVEPAAPAPEHARDARRSSLEMRFTELLADPVLHDQELLDTVVEMCRTQTVPAALPDDRGAAWCELLAVAAQLGERSSYVGTFKVKVDAAVTVARRLPADDREIAALLILDRTAAAATSARDFRHGVIGARTIDPRSMAPRSVIDSVLRPCLHYSDPSGSPTVALGLSVALAVLGSGNGQSISIDDMWALRAAISSVNPSLHSVLRTHVDKLTGQDRRVLEALLTPERKPHFWQRRRRDSWETLEASMRPGTTSADR